MLGQRRRRWDNIVPTLAGRFRVCDGPAFGPTLAQGFCLLMPALPGGCGQRTDVVLLLGRRPKRWPSSEAAFAGGSALDIFICGARRTRHVESILVWRWSSVVDGELTLGQRWFGVACLLGSSCIAHRPNINLINPVAAAGHCAGVVLMLGF